MRTIGFVLFLMLGWLAGSSCLPQGNSNPDGGNPQGKHPCQEMHEKLTATIKDKNMRACQKDSDCMVALNITCANQGKPIAGYAQHRHVFNQNYRSELLPYYKFLVSEECTTYFGGPYISPHDGMLRDPLCIEGRCENMGWGSCLEGEPLQPSEPSQSSEPSVLSHSEISDSDAGE